ncbi:MAG: STAS domain-containing protein [Candidatus Hydrogenedentes bacterium]|nr:STAS domain-containing protein [Candidatus Hydrogenedentota bacterium]
MKIERLEMGPVTVLRLEGDIDEYGVKDLRASLLECLKAGRTNLVVNMSSVRFLSYMGLGVLVERLRQVRMCHGDMKLVGLNVYMERLFRMVGVTSLFETFDNEVQAVQIFREAA